MPVLAVTNRVMFLAPPKARLAGSSGNSTVPRCLPEGSMAQMPPPPATYILFSMSILMPSGFPVSATSMSAKTEGSPREKSALTA